VNLLKKHIHHTAAIYTFFAALQQSARTQGPDHALLWWETGPRCESRYFDHGTWHILSPDAMFAYKMGKTKLSFWLEWESGATDKSGLKARMEAYAHYVQAREWVAAGLQALPVLLMVVPGQSHYQPVSQIVSEHAAGTGLIVRITTTSLVTGYGPLGAIWSQLVPLSQDSRMQTVRRSLLDLSIT
jgi:hypothetical protein